MIVLAGASTAASFIKKTSSVKLKVDGLGETSFMTEKRKRAAPGYEAAR